MKDIGSRLIRKINNVFVKQPEVIAPNDNKVRLHLGCGSEYWEGYVNIDSRADIKTDLQLDFTKIGSHYADFSVAEVALIHSISYLRLFEARDLFSTIFRMLEPGGRMIIECPDFVKCATKALNSENNLSEYLEGIRGLYAFDMDQIKRKDCYLPYAFTWSTFHLQSELKAVGFKKIDVCPPLTHDQRIWRDIRIEATKNQ